jgi:hypothetical protein
MHCIKETLTRESQTEGGKMSFGLNCKMGIGLWNVRTLAQSGKLKQVCRETENYKFGEIAIQNGFSFLYSGYNADEEPVHHDGVRLLISKITKRSPTEWHPISEGILTAHFSGNV